MDFSEKIIALDKLPAEFALTPVLAKRPFLSGWAKKSTTREEVAKALATGKADGFGIKLGIQSGGICAIDVDGTAARCKLWDVMGDEKMPPTVEFASGKLDRSQYLFTIPEALWATIKTKTQMIEGEEFGFFWDGRQSVLPPSSHPETGKYFWVQSPDEVEIAPIPNKLLEFWLNLINPPIPLVAPRPQAVKLKPTKTNSDIFTIPIERLLTKHHRSVISGVITPGRNATATSLARDLLGVAALKRIECDYRGKDYVLTIEGDPEILFNNFCSGCSPSLFDGGEREIIWNSAQKSDHQPSIRDEEILKNCARSYLKEIFPAPGRPKKQKTLVDRDYFALGKRLGINLPAHGVDEDGVPTSKLLMLELDLLDLYGSRIEFNEMSREIELDRQPIDLNTAKEFVSRSLFYDSQTEECIIALNIIAVNHKYDPVKEYLNSVRGKATKDFIKQIPLKYWGNTDELQNKLFYKKLVASVARKFKPGTKDDTLLILQGAQDTRKSTAISILAGGDYFNDDLRKLEDKDELAKLSRFWLFELAEVDYLFGKKEIELFKRFLSTKEDTFRPPYGRANIRVKRSCSFFATTNKSEFLQDPTGDRRYWIVEVGQLIDTDGLQRDRDLIWAAAVDAYESGDTSWLDKEETQVHAAANEIWREDDPWGEAILERLDLVTRYIGSLEYVKTQDIIDKILGIPLERQDKRTRNRVGATLRMNGFSLNQQKIDGKNLKVWTRVAQGSLTFENNKRWATAETLTESTSSLSSPSSSSFKDLGNKLIISDLENINKNKNENEIINNCFTNVNQVSDDIGYLGYQPPEPASCNDSSGSPSGSPSFIKQKDGIPKQKDGLPHHLKIGDRVAYLGGMIKYANKIGILIDVIGDRCYCNFVKNPNESIPAVELRKIPN